MDETRKEITKNFAFWAAMSAARQGPKTYRGKKLYKVFEKIELGKRLDNLYSEKIKDFEEWHEETTIELCKIIRSFGWAAKLLNLILKIEVYIGGRGNKKLISLIHPPLDNKLVKEIDRQLRKKGADEKLIANIKKAIPIKDVESDIYYYEIIPALEEAISQLGFKKLIELEKIWDPTK